LKIIFICRGDPLTSNGGTEIFTGNLSKELGKQGVDVTIVHSSETFSTTPHPEIKNVEFKPLHLTEIPYIRSMEFRRKCAKSCKELVEQSNVDAVISMGAGTFGFYTFKQLKKLKKKTLSIFYAMDTMIMEYERGKKSTEITNLFSSYKRWFWYNELIKSDKASCSSASLIVSSSKDTTSHLISAYRVSPEKVSLLYEGIPSDYADGYDIVDPSTPVFFHIGGGVRKGTDYFLKALVVLKEKYGIKAKGIVARATQANINYAQKLDLDVEFHARLELPELKKQYATCTAFVAPSLSEGFCLPIIEAEMFGKPCIITDTGSLPELIVDGYNGLIVVTANVDNLVEKMFRIATDHKLRIKMGDNARNSSKSFTISTTAVNLIDYIKSNRDM
jgi:glycosyltransferase involved in cell wall biosynthesis